MAALRPEERRRVARPRLEAARRAEATCRAARRQRGVRRGAALYRGAPAAPEAVVPEVLAQREREPMAAEERRVNARTR